MLYRNLKKDVNQLLDKELPTTGTVALTSDGWQASNQNCFLAVTLHYINNQFEFRSMLLECKGYKGKHTGTQIASVLEEVINSYPSVSNPNLQRVCTTDGASNMAKAIRETNPVVSQLICVAHMLNNAIQEAVTKSPIINDVVNCAKELSQKLHRSTADQEVLEEYCEENNGNYSITYFFWLNLIAAKTEHYSVKIRANNKYNNAKFLLNNHFVWELRFYRAIDFLDS